MILLLVEWINYSEKKRPLKRLIYDYDFKYKFFTNFNCYLDDLVISSLRMCVEIIIMESVI